MISGVNASFGNHNSVANGGVLFLIPALISQGLITIKETHTIREGYYKLESIILTLAIMALCRIKNPEQLKNCSPGELGKLIGLDRVPEVKCLREKLDELFSNNTTKLLNEKLAQQWIETNQDNLLLYTDGHVKIYNGQKANLTKKFISRQKLCLPATTDFWLNDEQGLPLMVWTGELSEKLQNMIEYKIIPDLLSAKLITQDDNTSNKPICTLVFDREAYEPAFFARLWQTYRIAIITYRKNVKDMWAENDFEKIEIEDDLKNKTTMLLGEKEIELNNFKFREIRRINSREHQTAIITTHPHLDTKTIALSMFKRWQQENYFKYMIADYNIDHITQYGIEHIDLESQVVNPEYRSITYQIKKEKEKLQRMKAKLLQKITLTNQETIDKIKENIETKAVLVEQIELKEIVLKSFVLKREGIPKKIKLSEMSDEKRYNKLQTESSYFMSTIKMICYRAETVVANLLDGKYSRYIEEKRMLIKNIISTPIDLNPDYTNKTLTVTLHTLSTPKANELAGKIAIELNNTETIFPGTELKMIFKSVAY